MTWHELDWAPTGRPQRPDTPDKLSEVWAPADNVIVCPRSAGRVCVKSTLADAYISMTRHAIGRTACPERKMVDERRAPSVLLVEHGQDCRWFWRMAVDGDARFGPVFEVESTSEALDLLTREYPDVVVADLPSCDGVDLLEYLKSRYPMPIVVATSTSADIADIAMECGATAFWTKPDSLSPEMSEHLWRLWEGRNKGCDGTDPNATDAGQRGWRSQADPSGSRPTDDPDERRG